MDRAARNKFLAVIHAEKKKACLSDADYRAVLLEVAGVESAGECDERQLKKLADHFRSFGRPAARKNRGDDFYRIIEGTPNWKQKRHIAAMWVELGYKASALDSRAFKQFGASDFTFLSGDQLQTLGRDLAKRLARKKKGDGRGAA